MQLVFGFPERKQRGGARLGAGRKPRAGRRPTPHRARPKHSRHHPVHVVIRLVPGLPSLRTRRLFGRVHAALSKVKLGGARRSRHHVGDWVDYVGRIVHYSVQANHIHLIVEAGSKQALTALMRGLGVSLARRLNPVLARRGQLIAERYHVTTLRSPLQVKHALAYVLNNGRKHLEQQGQSMAAGWVDPCSSAHHFPHWVTQPGVDVSLREHWAAIADRTRAEPSVVGPLTWLLRVGWLKHGPIELSRVPGGSTRQAAAPIVTTA